MAGCALCNDGYILDEELGISVKCSCNIDGDSKVKLLRADKPVYNVTNAHKELALEMGLIPEHRINDEYSREFAEQRISEICAAQSCAVVNSEVFLDTSDYILANISTGTLRKSYILGAPNSFGKTTFVNTCIKRLLAMNRKVTNYISLFELAVVRAEYEKELLGYKSKLDETEEISKFTWNDYMKSDVLFTYLTDLENRRIEAKILKIILDIRGPKELPTIVTTSSSLKPYLNDLELKKYVWNDILSYNDETASCDRLIHKSCFKVFNLDVSIKI